jgi:LysR family nitrogen assimilation transcriptional regulator
VNLRQLRYFVKVIEAGNMTRAAETLHVAQPALGMQIRALEEDLGVALLVRHSRGIAPTRAGNLLYARAQSILSLVDAVRGEVTSSEADATETVRLGLTPSLMERVGPDIALAVRDQLPQVALSLAEDMSHRLADALVRGELDMALAYEVPEVPEIVRRALYQEDLVLVTLPGPHADRPVAFAEALEETLVMPEPRDSVRSHVARMAGALGLALKVAYEIRSIPAIKNMILRGVAAGILPLGVVRGEVAAGRLVARPIVAPAARRTLFLATAAGHGRPRNEVALSLIIRGALQAHAAELGTLAHPIALAGA